MDNDNYMNFEDYKSQAFKVKQKIDSNVDKDKIIKEMEEIKKLDEENIKKNLYRREDKDNANILNVRRDFTKG